MILQMIQKWLQLYLFMQAQVAPVQMSLDGRVEVSCSACDAFAPDERSFEMPCRRDWVCEHLPAVDADVDDADHGREVADLMMPTHVVHFSFSVRERVVASFDLALPGLFSYCLGL